jgi:hypothetical protein
LNDLAITLARRTRDSELLQEASVHAKEIESLKNMVDEVQKALDVLTRQPKEPAASLVVGRFRCFIKGDWKNGLPMMARGLPLVIVQPGVIYGPGDTGGLHTALVDLLRKRLPVTPRRTAFCWAHVEDTARGHILGMERGQSGETYIITGPRHTFEEAFDLVATLAKVPRPLLHPGPRIMRATAAVMSLIQKAAALPPALTPEALRVIAGTTYLGSNEKAVRALGFSARSLREGMDQTLEHELRALARLKPPR